MMQIKSWHIVMTKALKSGHMKLPNVVLAYNAEDNKCVPYHDTIS